MMAANTHLGFRSRLVLEKLGFELRPFFEQQMSAPLPERLQKLADELGGYAEWRDVGAAPEPARPAEREADEPWRWALSYDEPLTYR